jgi:cyclic-di-AMP phosphodiesterase PgpH
MDEQVPRLGQLQEQVAQRDKTQEIILGPSRPLQFALWIAVAALIALLLTPSLRRQNYGQFVEGKPSPRRVVAPQTFQIEDAEATREKRDEAAASVATVFDYDASQSEEIIKRLRTTFASVRETYIASGVSPLAPFENEESEQLRKAQRQALGFGALGDTPTTATALSPTGSPLKTQPGPEARAALDKALTPKLEALSRSLGASVTADELRQLKDAHFSESVEDALAELVTMAMSTYVIQDRAMLNLADKRAVSVRVLQGGRPLDEIQLGDANSVKDVAEAQRWVGQAALSRNEAFPKALREAVGGVAQRLVQANLSPNRSETQARRVAAAEAARPVIEIIEQGELIVQEGERVDDRTLMRLHALARTDEQSNPLRVFAGALLFTLMLTGMAHYYGHANVKKYRPGNRELAFLAFMLVITLALAKLWSVGAHSFVEWQTQIPITAVQYAVPIAMGGMLVRFIVNSETALLYSLVISPLFGLLFDSSMTMMAFGLVGSVAGAHGVRHVKERSQITKASINTGFAGMATVLCLQLFSGRGLDESLAWNLGGALSGGVIVALIVSTAAGLLEDLFRFTTDIRLLELANMNHPLLKDLLIKAPGTYHHSIMVGTLAEAGAEAIGANPLLSRVTAYYHDIGKTKKPEYFGENQGRGLNPHDRISPNMSATIIKSHVTYGVEMAKHYKLPQPIIDVIEQHHGTTLIAYFYNKAKSLAGDDDEVTEEQFRYDGPKPQFRESALVMIADHCEATAKSLAEPTEDRIRGLVQKLINKLFADGQFDEVELTLKDLHLIARAYTTMLTDYYSSTRPAYQTAATKDATEHSRPFSRADAARVATPALSTVGLSGAEGASAHGAVPPGKSATHGSQSSHSPNSVHQPHQPHQTHLAHQANPAGRSGPADPPTALRPVLNPLPRPISTLSPINALGRPEPALHVNHLDNEIESEPAVGEPGQPREAVPGPGAVAAGERAARGRGGSDRGRG